ncbi:MAG: tyrosine-type recombinase/integrase, partial [Clostridia bacterium]
GKYIVFSVKAHDLRHTFATALFDAGVPAKAAQYYLGHADIRITLELYTHFSQEREKTTRSQLVGFLDGWLKTSKIPSEELPKSARGGQNVVKTEIGVQITP